MHIELAAGEMLAILAKSNLAMESPLKMSCVMCLNSSHEFCFNFPGNSHGGTIPPRTPPESA